MQIKRPPTAPTSVIFFPFGTLDRSNGTGVCVEVSRAPLLTDSAAPGRFRGKNSEGLIQFITHTKRFRRSETTGSTNHQDAEVNHTNNTEPRGRTRRRMW